MILGGLRQRRPLTRLHLFRMLPCQLFFLALCTHLTRIIKSLLGHQIPALNDLLMGQPKFRCGSKAPLTSSQDVVPLCGV